MVQLQKFLSGITVKPSHVFLSLVLAFCSCYMGRSFAAATSAIARDWEVIDAAFFVGFTVVYYRIATAMAQAAREREAEIRKEEAELRRGKKR